MQSITYNFLIQRDWIFTGADWSDENPSQGRVTSSAEASNASHSQLQRTHDGIHLPGGAWTSGTSTLLTTPASWKIPRVP